MAEADRNSHLQRTHERLLRFDRISQLEIPLTPLPFVRYVRQLWQSDQLTKQVTLIDGEGRMPGSDVRIIREGYAFTIAGVQQFGTGDASVLRNVPAGVDPRTQYVTMCPSLQEDLSIQVTALSTGADALASFIEEEYEPLIYGAYVFMTHQGKEIVRPLSGRKRIGFYRGDVIHLPASDRRGNSVDTDILQDGTLYGILVPRVRYSGEYEVPTDQDLQTSEIHRRLRRRRIAQYPMTNDDSVYAWRAAVPLVIGVAAAA